MKHQGKYGFTYDSKAEEWAYWAASYADLRQFERDKWLAEWGEAVRPAKIDMAAYANGTAGKDCAAQQANYYAYFARHSPTQQQNTPEIALPTGRTRKAPLWPFAAGAAIMATLALVLASEAGVI